MPLTMMNFYRGPVGALQTVYTHNSTKGVALIKTISATNSGTSVVKFFVYLVPNGQVAGPAYAIESGWNVPGSQAQGGGILWTGLEVLSTTGDTIQVQAFGTLGVSINGALDR